MRKKKNRKVTGAQQNVVGDYEEVTSADMDAEAHESEGYPALDFDERAEKNLIVKAESRNKSVNVPSDARVHVPKGMMMAPGTYVDDRGVLRETSSGSVVVWHNPGGGCGENARPGEYLRGIQPHQILHDSKGAPWCPVCFLHNEQKAKLAQLFGDQDGKKLASKAEERRQAIIRRSSVLQDGRMLKNPEPSLTHFQKMANNRYGED